MKTEEKAECIWITFRTSVGFVNAVATEPARPPATILRRIFVDPNAISQTCFEGSSIQNLPCQCRCQPKVQSAQPFSFQYLRKDVSLQKKKLPRTFNSPISTEKEGRVNIQRPRYIPFQLKVLFDQ